MPEITCPQCGRMTDFVAIRRSADEFCHQCDFPLFWAPSSIPTTTPGGNSDATLRRLPGAGGRHRVGNKVCPTCGELNPITETHCLRCRNELDPRPQPEPEPAPPPPPPSPEPVVVESAQPWWVWVIVAVLCAAAAAAVVVAVI